MHKLYINYISFVYNLDVKRQFNWCIFDGFMISLKRSYNSVFLKCRIYKHLITFLFFIVVTFWMGNAGYYFFPVVWEEKTIGEWKKNTDNAYDRHNSSFSLWVKTIISLTYTYNFTQTKTECWGGFLYKEKRLKLSLTRDLG